MLTILMQNALEADLLLIFSTYFIFSTMFAFNCAHLQLHTHTHTQIIRLFVLSMLAHDCSLCECIGMHVQLNYFFIVIFAFVFLKLFFYSALNS